MSPVEVAAWLAGWVVSAPACAQIPVRQGPVTVVTRTPPRRRPRKHVPVHVWTIDDEAEMARLLDLGVDGIMTDRPQVLRDLLIRRGEWT